MTDREPRAKLLTCAIKLGPGQLPGNADQVEDPVSPRRLQEAWMAGVDIRVVLGIMERKMEATSWCIGACKGARRVQPSCTRFALTPTRCRY